VAVELYGRHGLGLVLPMLALGAEKQPPPPADERGADTAVLRNEAAAIPATLMLFILSSLLPRQSTVLDSLLATR